MITRKDEDGTIFAKTADGSWEPVPDGYVPEIKKEIKAPNLSAYTVGPTSGKPGSQPDAVANSNQMIRARNAYEQSLIGDAHGQMLKQDAKDMGMPTAMAISAGRQMDKFGAGMADIKDMAIPHIPFLEDSTVEESKERRLKRAVEQSRNDETFKHVAQQNPFSSVVGETLPFLMTGWAAKPFVSAVNKAGSLVGNSIMKPVEKLASKANKALDNAPGTILPMVARGTKKTRRGIQGRYNQNPIKDEAYTNLKTIKDTGLTGLFEGVGHYDIGAGEGVLNSIIGGALGTTSPLRKIEQLPNMNSPHINKILDKYEEKGVIIHPGMRLNNTRLQRNESAMASHPDYTNTMAAHKAHNDEKMTEIVGDAIGMKVKKGTSEITPDDFYNHNNQLKQELNDLQNSTTGKFYASDFTKKGGIRDDIQILSKMTDSQSIENLKVIKSYLKMINNRTDDGGFDGKQYADLHTAIKTAANDAFDSKNTQLGKSLTKLTDVLDNGIKRGMGEGSAKVKQWGDTREKVALSELTKEAGFTPIGSVNLDGMTNVLMNRHQAGRTLTGSLGETFPGQGKIRDLQDLIKYNHIAKNQAGSDMSGVELMNNSAGNKMMSPASNMVGSSDLDIDPMRRLFKDSYLRGRPSVKGLPVGTARQVSRASAQVGGPTEAADRAVQGTTMWAGEKLGNEDSPGWSPKDSFARMIERLNTPEGQEPIPQEVIDIRKKMKKFKDLVKELGLE